MELFLGTTLVTFDGTILEAFGVAATANGRQHILTLDRVEVKETRKEGYLHVRTIWGTYPLLVKFPEDEAARALQFAAEVNRAIDLGPPRR